MFSTEGNLGKTPEFKSINDGNDLVANYSVRVDRGYYDKDAGQYVEKPGYWLDVETFGNEAKRLQICVEQGTVKTGTRIFVKGDIINKPYTPATQDSEVQKLVLRADHVSLSMRNFKNSESQAQGGGE